MHSNPRKRRKLNSLCERCSDISRQSQVQSSKPKQETEEQFNFISILTLLASIGYQSFTSLVTMLNALIPIGFLIVNALKYFLNNVTEIVKAPDKKTKFLKTVVILAQLLVLSYCLYLFWAVLMFPFYKLLSTVSERLCRQLYLINFFQSVKKDKTILNV